MKEALRQICPPLLWRALRAVLRGSGAKTPQRRYYGLQELDRKLEKHLDFDGGFFVEIGGWDGVTYSNTLYFERFRNWRGLLIEPAPNEFVKCRANRPDAQVVCAACVPFGFTERFIPMTWCASMTAARSTGNASNQLADVDGHIASGRKFLRDDEAVFEFGAVAAPLSAILDERRVERTIDLLVLDVEGFELSVLQGIDFARHAPRFICVEVWQPGEIARYLGARGYRLVEQLSHMPDCQDYLFARE